MRLLYIPLSTAEPDSDDLYKAFCKKCEVRWFDSKDPDGDMINAVHFHPEVVYIHSGAVLPHIVYHFQKFTRAIITQWTGDYRPEGFDYVRETGKYCHITFKADLENLYPDLNCKYLPHGVADWQFREINPEAKGIIFIGNSYTHFPGGKERQELCESLAYRSDFTWIGSGGKIGHVPFKEIPDWYNRHKFAIAANVYNDAKGWIGNRALMAMAAGCCTIIREFPDSHKHFPTGNALWTCIKYDPSVENITDLLHKIHVANLEKNIFPEYLQTLEIRKAGQKLIRENFTYDKIVESYLNQL